MISTFSMPVSLLTGVGISLAGEAFDSVESSGASGEGIWDGCDCELIVSAGVSVETPAPTDRHPARMIIIDSQIMAILGIQERVLSS